MKISEQCNVRQIREDNLVSGEYDIDIHRVLIILYLILILHCTYTGCPKKNKTGFLLNISATKYQILK